MKHIAAQKQKRFLLSVSIFFLLVVTVLSCVWFYFSASLAGAAINPTIESGLKIVTFYDYTTPASETQLEHLRNALPAIKATGFNTIWFVSPWYIYNPQPLASPPVYNEQAFSELKQTLDLLRANNMQAILGLNYLGDGWSPTGIDPYTWPIDPTSYHAFETYVEEFLTRIVDYKDMVFILFFTEGADAYTGYENSKTVAANLRATLGSLPTRLPAALRNQFTIGYHDYTIINLNYGEGESPIASPNPFDFLSMVAYELDALTDSQIVAEIDLRAGRFKTLYPGTPLIIGESGASSCAIQGGEANQARVLKALASRALGAYNGINIWSWLPFKDEVCPRGTLGITNSDGSPKLAVADLRSVFNSTSTAVNGVCSATHYNCSSGTSDATTEYSNQLWWWWWCYGSNGGTISPTCGEAKPAVINGSCSSSHYSCSSGTSASNVSDTSSYTWSCVGSNEGTTASCSETKTCASFTYSAWGTCSASGVQTRTVDTQSPSGCTGGSPVLSQACTYTTTIGGTISGLSGTVVLQNNGGDNLTQSANGSFTFATAIHSGDAYAATVYSQPSGQTCVVSSGTGTVASGNVTNVSVTCSNNSDTTPPTAPSGLLVQ